MTQVEVNGLKGVWVKGPDELVYITGDGCPAAALAPLATGGTLIWSIGQVALRREGNFGKAAPLIIAGSARWPRAGPRGNLPPGGGVAVAAGHHGRSAPMPRRLIAATALAAGMSVVLLGCTGGPAGTVTGAAPVAGSAGGSAEGTPAGPARYPARPVTMAGARRCPVTIGHPVPGTVWWRDQLFGSDSAYGNGLLWVGGLWPDGVVIMTEDDVGPDGRLGMKFGWYRLTNGYLTITGRRLDGPAPPASGLTVPGGYGMTGFNASGVIFPAEGCWQVTGRVGRVALTFVTFVIKGRCDVNAVPIRCVAGRVR